MQYLTVLYLISLPFVIGHARWKCPKARDFNSPNGAHISFDNTGNKVGPCGPYSGVKYWGLGGVTKLNPGLMTFIWEESISHKGSPFRLAILDENEKMVALLLDHIPHWDNSHPNMMNESSYVPYKITVNIPDINCTQCSLQLLYIMTDKTTFCNIENCTYYSENSACSGHIDDTPQCFGAPNSDKCLNPNTCFSNYHSCTDIRINGKLSLKDYYGDEPNNWPYSKLKKNVYRKESANWENGWLLNIPKDFTTPVGICV
jgi:hypothetical protein